MAGLRWSQDDDNYLKQVYEKTSIKILCKEFNRSEASIKLRARNLNLRKCTSIYRKTTGSNLTKKTLTNAYWVGFILADGHLSSKNRLKITLSIKDKNHLENFSKIVNCPIKESTVKTNFGTFTNVSLSFQDQDLGRWLRNNFNIESRKTVNPPDISSYNLTNEEMMALIIGFIDGDGSIVKLTNREYYNIKIKNHKNWFDNLNFISIFLQEYFKIKSNMKVKINKNGYACLVLSNSEIFNKLIIFINDHHLPILERKWKLGQIKSTLFSSI